jgi:hypothetical protein
MPGCVDKMVGHYTVLIAGVTLTVQQIYLLYGFLKLNYKFKDKITFTGVYITYSLK